MPVETTPVAGPRPTLASLVRPQPAPAPASPAPRMSGDRLTLTTSASPTPRPDAKLQAEMAALDAEIAPAWTRRDRASKAAYEQVDAALAHHPRARLELRKLVIGGLHDAGDAHMPNAGVLRKLAKLAATPAAGGEVPGARLAAEVCKATRCEGN